MYVILIEEYFDNRESPQWSTIEDYYFETLEKAEEYLINNKYYKEDLFYCYAYIKKLELLK